MSVKAGALQDALWHEHPPRITTQPCPELELLSAQPDGLVIGARVDSPHALAPALLAGPPLWERPRFTIPQLGLVHAALGQIITVVQERYLPGEITAADEHHLYALEASVEGRSGDAAYHWRRALEAGDLRAHRYLGALLLQTGATETAAAHLRYFTALDPTNQHAWADLADASASLGRSDEAQAARARSQSLGTGETEATGLTDLTSVEQLVEALHARHTAS